MFLAPDGSNKEQIKKFKEKTIKLGELIRTGHVDRHEAWTALSVVAIKTLEYADSTCWPRILLSPYCVQYYCDLTYFLLFIVVTMRLKTKVFIGFLCLSSIVIQCQSCLKAFTSIDNLPQPRYYGTHYKVSNNIAL